MNTDLKLEVKGFRFAACAAGIKKSGKPDLALIVSDTPAVCAGVFTTNQVVASSVEITRERFKSGHCQAILVNSGNANACTGLPGRSATLRCGTLAAQALNLDEHLIALASTGVIGQPLPMTAFEDHIPGLALGLSPATCAGVAEAIRTTDAFVKTAVALGESDGKSYRIVAVAKGAGMIHPNMATMLAFVMTDACVEPQFLATTLRTAVDESFNSITVDRDTSTNDMVLVLANGASGGEPIKSGAAAATFETQLKAVLLSLAKMIVRDGEGATKLVEIRVRGAASVADARLAAASVATSSLVKTAFFGEDANWGRIIAAVGYSGAKVDQERVEILFDEIPVVRAGVSTGQQLEDAATLILKQPEFVVTIDLHLGNAEARYYTSDLTYDYIKCNASYRS